MKDLVVGIDLGTTHSLVGVMRAGQPILLPSPDGHALTPSAVGLDANGELLVGEVAKARALTHPQLTAINFKRDMGTDRQYTLGERTFTPQELSAAVLASLKRDAEAALGERVEQAVITVPAYFGDLQRQATRDAATIAGLTVRRIINEPTAAALAYGLHQLDRELRAVVLDLGGGTFDVTVLEIIEGVIEIQASAGDARLGGEDFVESLAELVRARILAEHGQAPRDDLETAARIHDACERAKRRLSSEPEALLALPGLALAKRTIDVELTITRADAHEQWRALLERIRLPIARALRDADLEPKQIDEVLLVGGATRMPCFVELAARMFERMPHRALPPDEAVALGAAIQAALVVDDEAVEDLVVTDIAPFTMGVETSARLGGRRIEGMFTPVLERGTVIPASRVERFFPTHDDQTSIQLEVYQGEHAVVRDNVYLGSLRVPLPRRGTAADKGIDVRFTYDLNGILEVDVTVLASGEQACLVIEQRPGSLSAEQLERARKAMAALKFHPRELLPNRTTLARAEALHVQLRGDEREALRELIHRFEAALASQRDEVIEPVRGRLQVAIERLSR